MLFGLNSFAEDQPVDIWNIDKQSKENNSSTLQPSEENSEINSTTEFEIFNMQKQKDDILVTSDDNLNSKEIRPQRVTILDKATQKQVEEAALVTGVIG